MWFVWRISCVFFAGCRCGWCGGVGGVEMDAVRDVECTCSGLHPLLTRQMTIYESLADEMSKRCKDLTVEGRMSVDRNKAYM